MPAYKVTKVVRPGVSKQSGHFLLSSIFSKAEAEKLLVVRNCDLLLQKLHEVLRPEINYLGDYEVRGNGLSLAAHSFALSALTECQEILSEMGPWAANKIAGYLIKDLQGMV